MLEWKIKKGDDKLKEEIKRTKETFDKWFNSSCWSKKYTKEQFLSKDCPVPHVRHKMILPFDEVKKLYPLDAKECCSDCEDYVDEWIETSFSFCNEYGCGIKLCKKCANKLKNKINELNLL